jgi:hypothetical protein
MSVSSRSTWPATIAIAVVALALGSVGTAVAGPALTEAKVKAIAAKVVKKKAPKLTVGKAKTVKDGAVTGASVADGSLAAADLAVGVVPADGYLLESMNVATDPVPSPDTPGVIAQPFTLPRAGTAHVRLFVARASADCSAGTGTGGLYIDGVPVSGTRRSLPVPGAESALELVGSAAVSAGPHQLRYGIDCPSGTNTGSAFINATWTVMMAAE